MSNILDRTGVHNILDLVERSAPNADRPRLSAEREREAHACERSAANGYALIEHMTSEVRRIRADIEKGPPNVGQRREVG